MKLYSCDFEGCTATTEKLADNWKRIEDLPRGLWIRLTVIPIIGTLLLFFVDEGRHLCPAHAKRIKGLVRT